MLTETIGHPWGGIGGIGGGGFCRFIRLGFGGTGGGTDDCTSGAKYSLKRNHLTFFFFYKISF